MIYRRRTLLCWRFSFSVIFYTVHLFLVDESSEVLSRYNSSFLIKSQDTSVQIHNNEMTKPQFEKLSSYIRNHEQFAHISFQENKYELISSEISQ